MVGKKVGTNCLCLSFGRCEKQQTSNNYSIPFLSFKIIPMENLVNTWIVYNATIAASWRRNHPLWNSKLGISRNPLKNFYLFKEPSTSNSSEHWRGDPLLPAKSLCCHPSAEPIPVHFKKVDFLSLISYLHRVWDTSHSQNTSALYLLSMGSISLWEMIAYIKNTFIAAALEILNIIQSSISLNSSRLLSRGNNLSIALLFLYLN